MFRIKLYIGIVLIVLFGSGCLKEETPVLPPQPGAVETVQIEIGFPYINQVYYNCSKNEIIKTNSKYEWDFSLECSEEGFHILLNTAKGVFVTNQGVKDFESITNVKDVEWLWDNPNGNLDSTAIDNWVDKKEVFIIDLQFDKNGKHLGYKKIIFLSVDSSKYMFKYADLDGSNERNHTVLKDTSINFIQFSFLGEGTAIKLEPSKNDWDLLFTNHYHKFDNLPLPFVLTQVLSNKYNGVRIAQDDNNNFTNIVLRDTSNYSFTNHWNEVGYDWKIRNSQDNSFSIDVYKSYIVQTTSGLFYKIRFIDFYNDQGQKGYPKFEVQRL